MLGSSGQVTRMTFNAIPQFDQPNRPVHLAEKCQEKDARIPILFVTTRLGGGGAERHLVRIANSLQERYDVQVAVLRGGGSYVELLRSEIPLNRCGPAWSDRSTLACCVFGAAKLRKIIEQAKPACCFAILEPAAYALNRAMETSDWKCASIVCVQNNIDYSLRQFQKLPKRLLMKGIVNAFHRASAIVSISDGVARGVFHRWPGIQGLRRTIYNAAFENVPDLSKMDLVPRGEFKPPRHLLVACGRLTEQKGFVDLLHAVQVSRQSVDVGLWLLGEGPQEKRLKRLAAQLGLAKSVHFLGFRSDPLRFFAAADVFVLSSWWEGFGNVLVEAMSVGTAVVSTDCPHGPAEIIEHGRNGILVPPRSPELLANAILSLLKDRPKRTEIAKAGRLRALDFCATSIAELYARVISDVTTRRRYR